MSIEVVKHNLTIERGRDFREYFGFRADDAVVNPDGSVGSYIDLTGATIKAQIRESQSPDSRLIATFTVDMTDALTSADIYLTLTDAQTAAITDEKGYYDILVTDAAGNDETWVYGEVAFVGRPTQK